MRGEAGKTEQIILHVDMDAFFAAVEVRDNPSLRGKPLIIGSLPHERGVVATCSYEARPYGVRSGMNIKDAYRLCPQGVYMHPNFDKYKTVSRQLHEIWEAYASAAESIALDEAYLDLTETAGDWETAREIAQTIKRRTLQEVGLTCSVGVAYSKTAAKTASEEKKPDGYFEIRTAEDFVNLIIDRDVRVLYTVGAMTAEKLHGAGIHTVRDIRERQEEVIRLLGKQGRWITRLAQGAERGKPGQTRRPARQRADAEGDLRRHEGRHEIEHEPLSRRRGLDLAGGGAAARPDRAAADPAHRRESRPSRPGGGAAAELCRLLCRRNCGTAGRAPAAAGHAAGAVSAGLRRASAGDHAHRNAAQDRGIYAKAPTLERSRHK